MKVSILIPIYGVELFIEKCTRSLMEQTYKDIEYIFVNDCSPDNSVAVLESVVKQYPDRISQVHIISHESNKGLAGARQTGLEAATGDTVLFIDSDDYIKTNTVERLVETMQATNADVVDGGYSIEEEGVITSNFYPLHLSSKAYLKTILCQSVESNRVVGRLIKHSLFSKHGITFIQGVDFAEDFSVIPRILANATRSWVDECFYLYRQDNPDSYSHNISTKNAVSYYKAQQIVGSYFVSHNNLKNYRFAAEMGWVDAWRFARRFNVDKTLVDEHFKLKPSHFVTRLLYCLMKSSIPFSFVNFCYKAVRTIYLKSIR